MREKKTTYSKQIRAVVIVLGTMLLIVGCKGEKESTVRAMLTEPAEQIRIQAEAAEQAAEEALAEAPLEELTLDVVESVDGDGAQDSGSGTGEVTWENVAFDTGWTYADSAVIYTGEAVLYHTGQVWNGITVGVNAGHGTSGGTSVKTYCHPDRTAKVTGGTTAAGSLQAVAVSSGMTFSDGTPESQVTLRMAQILRDKLLDAGYDVLMIRDGEDVQLDNVARTVMCNNLADCHIALHWDGDGLNYDKGCFYIRVPDGIKYMEPVASTWQQDDALGQALVDGLQAAGAAINGGGSMAIDLTQTSYSCIPSVDIELGNQASDHSDGKLDQLGEGLLAGVNGFFGY